MAQAELRVFRCVASAAHFFILYILPAYENILKGDFFMPDYKEMYLTLLDNVEKALNTFIDAQKACEEIYINADEK